MWSIGDIGKRPKKSKNKEIKHERMTAVEWFAVEIKGGKLITNQKFKDLLEQAKEMEIEEKRLEYMNGWVKGFSSKPI